MNDQPRSKQKRDRRTALALIGSGGAAAMAAVVGHNNNAARAATGDPLILGQSNDAGDNYTWLHAWNPFAVSFQVDNHSGSGVCLSGASSVPPDTDPEPFGKGAGTGVAGVSGSGPGVEGHSRTGMGVVGICTEGPQGYGVVGAAPAGTGVHGKSEFGAGVNGVCREGPGVVGEAPGDHPGVLAKSRSMTEPYPLDGGLALDVVGKARFSTCGDYAVPPGDSSVFVPNAAVTGQSHITITLVGDPGPRQLQWVQKSAGSGFTVYLTTAARPLRPETPFTYLIVEPGGP